MRKKFAIAITALLFLVAGSAIGETKSETSLQKERTNLARTNNPVERTKINIKISDLLITMMTDAARAGDDKLVEQHIAEYANTIQDAHLTMLKTGKDAHKHPDGFKDLEISLRKQQRLLTDAGKLMDYEQRESLEKVRKLASDIDDQLVRVMFIKEPNAGKK